MSLFTKVEVRNSQGSLLTLQLGDTSNGILVQEFTGLDPVKATLVSSSFANQDGAIYQASQRDTRNITLKLGIDPDPSVSTVRALRNQVFSFFRPKSEVTMTFFVDDASDSAVGGYQIVGRVESCASAMFVQEPEVDISIICFDPDFIDPIPVTLTGMWTTDTQPRYVTYPGTSETGITLSLNINRTLSQFTLYYTDPNNVIWSMDVVVPLVVGDVVTVSTVSGSKGATLVRNGITSSILYAISPQSVWPQLSPGVCKLRVSATGAGIPVTISYTKRYGGL